MSGPTNGTHWPRGGLQIIQIRHGERSLAISWMDNFNAFKKRVCALFVIPDHYEVKLSVNTKYENRTVAVEITYDLWPTLQDQVRTILLIANPPPYYPCDGNKTVYIKTLTGQTATLDCVNLSTNTALNIKAAIQDRMGIPPYQQRLVCNGKQLEDDRELHWYGVEDKSTIHMIMRLRGGWSWVTHFREQQETRDPLPRAEPLDPSRFIRENFLCLHYKHRSILTSWNADFMAFKEHACQLLEAAAEHTVYFFIELAIFGSKKMEVDPGTWPLMEGLISDVWASEEVPFRETRDVVASTPGPILTHTESTVSNRQQIDSKTSTTEDPSVPHQDTPQFTSNPTHVAPNYNQVTRQAEHAPDSRPSYTPGPFTSNLGDVHPTHASSNLDVQWSNSAVLRSSPSHASMPFTSNIGRTPNMGRVHHPHASSNLDVPWSNSTGVTSKRSIGERIRDKWRRMVS